MELPQPRPKDGKATHDFLSLYPFNEDPAPTQVVTHDFLQPLERVGAREESVSAMANLGSHRAWPAQRSTVDSVFPGGLGACSISFIGQRGNEIEKNVLATDWTSKNDERSFKSFAFVEGKTGKEIVATGTSILPNADVVGGEWTSSYLDKSSWLISSQKDTTAPLSSVSSMQQIPSKKKRSFMDMITSAKNDQLEDEEEKELTIKRETTSSYSNSKGNSSFKLESRGMEQKSNTIRSKHSATEQRRRSKINDRFQKLREVIPNSEQKKDKASFLLEVIEYIQFLQEKVSRFEGPFHAWNHETAKMMPLRNDHASGFMEDKKVFNMDSRPVPVGGMNFDGDKPFLSPSIVSNNGQHLSDSDLTTAKSKESGLQPPETTPQKIGATPTMRQNLLSVSETENNSKMNDHGPVAIESGTISISSAYSQGLLKAITQALQISGVNLSESKISVKIDLGKRANGSSASKATEKDVATIDGIREDLGFTLKNKKRKAEAE